MNGLGFGLFNLDFSIPYLALTMSAMAIEDVRMQFRAAGIENRIIELNETTATVEDAARAHGVEPGQIGKTMSFRLGEDPILIVVAGDSKISNSKYKARFAAKARMLRGDEVRNFTGHPIGGVCPFGLPKEIPVYLDESLRRFREIIPAAGSHNSSIRLSISELETHSAYQEWVDVCMDIEKS